MIIYNDRYFVESVMVPLILSLILFEGILNFSFIHQHRLFIVLGTEHTALSMPGKSSVIVLLLSLQFYLLSPAVFLLRSPAKSFRKQ